MNKRAAIYARVSTDDQAERGYSLPSQVDACQKFADVRAFDVVGVYQDEVSGTLPITRRPAGAQLQGAINSGQVNTVIIYQVDRLSRDIANLLVTIQSWLRAGIDIYSLDIGRQITSENDIVVVIMGWQGSDERNKIIERTSRGRNKKASSGKAVGSGPAPYGYIYQYGELSIKESEAQIVQMIFNWYVNGEEQGEVMSIVGIAKRLSQMGILTPAESKGWKHKRARAAGIWDGSTVHWILLSETYCGVLRYGKNMGKNGNNGKRPENEQIAIPVPPIITRELWVLAQERRAFNSRIAKRRAKRDYLLRALIKCGCGRNMSGSKGRYICTGRYDYSLLETCLEPLLKGELIEAVVWDYILCLITSEEQFESKLRTAQREEVNNLKPLENELENLDSLIIQTEQEADQVAQAISKTQGVIAASLEKKAEEIDRRYQALFCRKGEIEERIQTCYLTNDTISNLLEFRQIVAAGLQNPTFEDKRHWLEILRVEVIVYRMMATITCRLPIDPVTIDLAPNSSGGNHASSIELRISRSLKTARHRK
jgi:site-specific DNA recombinase